MAVTSSKIAVRETIISARRGGQKHIFIALILVDLVTQKKVASKSSGFQNGGWNSKLNKRTKNGEDTTQNRREEKTKGETTLIMVLGCTHKGRKQGRSIGNHGR